MMEDATFGGYLAVHHRPPGFAGSDGNAYSAEVYVDDEPCEDGRYGAAVLFVRWSGAGDHPDGHIETEYLAFGDTTEEAGEAIQRMTLYELKEHLDRLIENRKDISDW
jgi:hypothetical protein